MKNITEISETDFRKLDLIGYKYEKMIINSNCWRMNFEECHLNKELDEQKKYVEENKSWVKTVAFFVTDLPTEDDVKKYYESYQGIKDDNERLIAAKNHAFMEVAYCDKYYWRTLGTFTSWAAVNHIYSKRNKWIVDADSEPGELYKKGIKRIYIVYLGE